MLNFLFDNSMTANSHNTCEVYLCFLVLNMVSLIEHLFTVLFAHA